MGNIKSRSTSIVENHLPIVENHLPIVEIAIQQ
jgi:hypothetical protein